MDDKPKNIPSMKQYHNRLSELLAINPDTVTSKASAENYVEKVSDWIEFLETNELYQDIVKTIYQNEELISAEAEYIESAQKLANHIKRMNAKAKRYVTRRKMALPTWDEVFNKYVNKGVHSVSVSESLGQDLSRLNKLDTEENIAAGEVNDYYGYIWHTKFDFETLTGKHPYTQKDLDDLETLKNEYKRLETQLEERRRITGVKDYGDLKGVLEWHHNQAMSFNQLEFSTGAMAARILDRNFNSSWHTIDEVKNDARRFQNKAQTVANRIDEELTNRKYTLGQRSLRKVSKFFKWAINKTIGFLPFRGN